MRTGLFAVACVGLVAACVAPATADRLNQDVIWARQAPGAVMTVDGVLGEASWAGAETKLIRYGINNGNPGSGYKEEGGRLAKDSTYAELKFLVVGNQLYLGITVRDSSVGGGPDFNRFDGLLMNFKDHTSLGAPKPAAEFLYAWWSPDTCDHAPSAVGKSPHALGKFGYPTSPLTQCNPRTAGQIAAWACSTVVNGIANSDTLVDVGYTMEMRVALDSLGYNAQQAAGETIEFNISIYDTDWYWPLSLARFSSNRTWWQNPWGNVSWYDEVQVKTKPGVNVFTGAAPDAGPDLTLHQGTAPIVVNGLLTEPVWTTADSIRITYNDVALRASYPGILRYRAGQYQPPVNGGTSTVYDPGDMTVKWFFSSDSLYIGYNVRDQFVQYVNLVDRWDGVITSINDRVIRSTDRNLTGRRLTFHIGPGGVGTAEDYLVVMRDSLNGAKFALALKPGTTVDTTGTDVDQGYTAELKLDLTKLGYPHGLGDRVLWAGFDLLDGDSFGTPATLAYATRTWFGREYENECCPAYVWMGGGNVLAAPGDATARPAFQLLGNAPNPFGSETTVRFALTGPSRVTMDVFDLGGRRVARRDFGLQTERIGQLPFASAGLRNGLYLYRVTAIDPETGAQLATGSGKMMILQ